MYVEGLAVPISSWHFFWSTFRDTTKVSVSVVPELGSAGSESFIEHPELLSG